jgi:hypothetical protein
MVPDRAGADTRVEVLIPFGQIRQMDGGSAIEQAWLNTRLGQPGYSTGTGAATAACDALTIPVVTGHADPAAIDQIITLVLAHAGHSPAAPAALSPQAHAALRDAIARLAIDFVSGPNGLASALRTGLLAPLQHPVPAAGHRLVLVCVLYLTGVRSFGAYWSGGVWLG